MNKKRNSTKIKNNNFYMSINVAFFKILGKIQSAIMTFGIRKSYIMTIATTIFSILYTWYNIFTSNTNNERIDVITLWPLILPIISALITLTKTIWNYIDFSKSIYIISNNTIKETVLSELELSKEQIYNGYKVYNFFNGISNEKYIMSEQINTYLQDISLNKNLDNKVIHVQDMKTKFKIVDDVARLVPSIMSVTFKSPSIIYNGKLLRLSSDLHLNTELVNVQKVGYFDGQCTHEIVYKEFKSKHDIDICFRGKRLLLDEKNICLDLDRSSCANFMGASTLVLTKDNHIIIGKQDKYSKSNKGRFAPSGSGLVSYSDLKGCENLNDVLVKAMNREFCEECNYNPSKVNNTIKTVIIGYVRLLERGGKPDFFGISYIDETEKNLRKNIKKTELGLVQPFESVKFDSFKDMPYVLQKFCDNNIAKCDKSISIQLYLIATILSSIHNIDKFMDNLIN